MSKTFKLGFRPSSANLSLTNLWLHFQIFWDPILQTTLVATRSGSISASTFLPFSSYSATRESGISAASVSSSTTPSVTILPTANVNTPVSSLTSTETRSFEYETSASLIPSESVETKGDSLTHVDLEITSTISPTEVSASAISPQLQTIEPSIFSSVILTTSALSVDSLPVTYVHIDTHMETLPLPYPTDMSQSSSDISQYQSDSISYLITTPTIPLITETSKSSIWSSIYSPMPDIYSSPHSMPDSGTSTPGLQNTPTSLSDQSVIVETIPSVQSSDSTVASIESTAVLATGSPSPFTISSSVKAAIISSPTLVQTNIRSTTVSRAELIVADSSSDIMPDSDIATVSPVMSPSIVVSTPITLSTFLSSHVDSSSVVGCFEPSTEHTLTPPLPGLEPSSAVSTSQEELSKTTSFSYPHTRTAVEVKPVPTASPSTTSYVSLSHTETVKTYPSLTENTTSSTLKSTTIHVDTVTVISTTEGNLTLERPMAVEEEALFEKNFGLFIFLIVAGSCMLGACCFVLAAKLYRKRRYTWDPQLAYQDAYADMVSILSL